MAKFVQMVVLVALIKPLIASNSFSHDLSSPSKTFTTPNFPENYSNDMNVRHTITAAPGSNLSITFSQNFEFEKSDDHCWDYVMVYKSEEVAQVQPMAVCDWSELGEMFCGPTAPAGKIEAGGEKMIIEFCSDESVLAKGASITWQVDGSDSNSTTGPVTTPPPTSAPVTTQKPTTSATNSNSTDESCGVSSAKYPASVPLDANGNIMKVQGIVGGNEAAPHSLPWMVSFGNCGGALVSDQWVITAAHCTTSDLQQMTLKLGQHASENTLPWLPVSLVKNHPQYNGTTMANDIAIVKLASPVTFTDKVKPLCLPADTDNWQNSQENALVAGWGRIKTGGAVSTALLQAIVEIVPKATCNTKYGGIITETMMCAGAPGKDTCQGDSGGPFVVRKNNRYVLAGVVSWGYGCADPLYPGVYNHVPSMRQWIRSETGL